MISSVDRLSRHAVILALAIPLLLLTACSGTGTASVPPNTIPLKVYRVIGPNGDSHVDPDSNEGCQLDNTEITTIINTFTANAPLLYGTATKVTWDGIVHGMTDPGIQSRISSEITSLYSRIYSTGQVYYDPASINVYFSGNYFAPGNDPYASQLFGATRDPHAALPSALGPLILVNDGAGPGGSGGDAAEVLRRLTLEHEMGHYLGRFNYNLVTMSNQGSFANRTYGSGVTARTFSSTGGEHVSDLYTYPHIMVSGDNVPPAGRAAVLPGVQAGTYTNTGQGAELGEVSRKLLLGDYNDWHR